MFQVKLKANCKSTAMTDHTKIKELQYMCQNYINI